LVNQKKNAGTQRFENDKREQKNTTGTFDEKKNPSSYMSREKERSQRRKKSTTSVIVFYVGSKSYKNLPNAMKR
jgi:hypothetical protein